MNIHKNHKIIKIEVEESLKKENLNINKFSKDFDDNLQKLIIKKYN